MIGGRRKTRTPSGGSHRLSGFQDRSGLPVPSAFQRLARSSAFVTPRAARVFRLASLPFDSRYNLLSSRRG